MPIKVILKYNNIIEFFKIVVFELFLIYFFITFTQVHGMGGLSGCLLTAIFADKDVVMMSESDDPIPGGWINQNVYIFFRYSLSKLTLKNNLK